MPGPRSLFRALTIASLLFPPVAALAQARDVKQIYTQLCAGCHGANFQGGSAPSLVSGQWKHGGDDASVTASILQGRPEGGMPPFAGAISPGETRALVIYLREQAARTKPAPKPAAPAATDGTTASAAAKIFRVETVSDGVSTPWSMTWLPDGRLLVTEKRGRLRIIENGRLLPEPVKGIPAVDSGGQGGLLDIALHPDYAKNGWIYLAFSDAKKDADGRNISMTAIVRGRLDAGVWVDEETIFRAPLDLYRPAGGPHFGCRIVFDGKDHVFFGIGERGEQKHAQDRTRPNGKIHRLNDDGTVPADNPFLEVPGALPSLWTWGNRNPQGLAMDPRTGVLWETEHGPRGGDELNVIRRGANYGWPVITYGMNYNGTPITAITAKEGMEQPVIHWTPSIAVCGINFYTGDVFPQWKGNLFVTALAKEELRRVVIDGENVVSQEVILSKNGRLRHVAQGPDGFLYLAVNNPDKIVRLVPADAAKPE